VKSASVSGSTVRAGACAQTRLWKLRLTCKSFFDAFLIGGEALSEDVIIPLHCFMAGSVALVAGTFERISGTHHGQ
jgi:hypothetical protein